MSSSFPNSSVITFIDTETTGLNPRTHEIIEIGLVKTEVSQDERGFWTVKILDEYERKVKPEAIDDADPVALRINNYSPELWVNASPKSEVVEELRPYLVELVPNSAGADGQPQNTLTVGGHCVHFDLAFITSMFREGGEDYPINRRVIDTYSVARGVFRGTVGQRYSLQALCDKLGVVNNSAHTALSDIRATVEIYERLLNYGQESVLKD